MVLPPSAALARPISEFVKLADPEPLGSGCCRWSRHRRGPAESLSLPGAIPLAWDTASPLPLACVPQRAHSFHCSRSVLQGVPVRRPREIKITSMGRADVPQGAVFRPGTSVCF